MWVADYVLMGYGTGAIMGVPGEDQRDWEFAHEHSLKVVRTVQPPPGHEDGAFSGEGVAINSDFLNGMRMEEAKQAAVDWLERPRPGAAENRLPPARLAVQPPALLGRAVPGRVRGRRCASPCRKPSCR